MTTPGGVAAHFANHRYHPNYPTEWGRPEGSGPHDPVRGAWVRHMVEKHESGAARWDNRSSSPLRHYPTDRPAVALRLLYLTLPPRGH